MKKIIAVTVPVLIIIACVIASFSYIGFGKISASVAGFTFPSDFKKDKMPLSTKNYDRLNEKEKQAYICIFNHIERHPEYIKVPKLSGNEFNNVFFAVKNDNPDMLCFSDSCNMITFLSTCLIELNYNTDVSECTRMQQVLLDRAKSIVGMMGGIQSDYEKELFIHDYIVSACTYESSGNASNAYGCLVEGEAVCSGYSRAAMLLLEYAGVESMLISGTGISEEEGRISHMWNIVWVDGAPYHLDVTWDDPRSDFEGSMTHSYFNLTTQEILLDHEDFSADIECTQTQANYFRREKLFFESYNRDVFLRIQEKLLENIENGMNYIEMMFATSDAYDDAVSSLIDNSSPFSDMYRIVNTLNDAQIAGIDTSHVNFAKDVGKNYVRIMFDNN